MDRSGRLPLLLVLAGLPAVALAQSASSPAPPPPNWSLLKSGAKLLDFATDPAEPKDFVQATRPAPDTTAYIPTGPSRPVRAQKPKTPAELKAMEAGLDAAAAQLNRRVGRPVPVEPPAVPAKAKPKG